MTPSSPSTKSLPLVSVVIPVYNHEIYVEAAIRSVLDQTYPNIELIIIDDGSSDRSVEVARKTIEQYSNREITLLVQENQGAHNTINRGLSLSKGEFLTILNSDDYYSLDRIEKLASHIQKENGEIIFSYVEAVGKDNQALDVNSHFCRWYNDLIALSAHTISIGFLLLEANVAVTSGNLFFTRNLYNRIGGFSDLKLAHDLDFILRATVISEPILLKEYLIYYRMHDTNTVSKVSHLIDDEMAYIFSNYLKLVLHEPPENKIAPCYWYWPNSFVALYWNSHNLFTGYKDLILPAPEKSLKNSRNAPGNPPKKNGRTVSIVTHELSLTGAPALALGVARNLLSQGFNVKVFSLIDGPIKSQVEKLGIKCYILPQRLVNRTNLRWPILRIAALFLLQVYFFLFARGTVIANSSGVLPVFLPLYYLGKVRKVIWYIHESVNPYSLMVHSAAQRILKDLRDKPAIELWFGSNATRKIWENHGFMGKTKYWSGIAESEIIKPQEKKALKKFLLVGTFIPRKGVHYLIEAFINSLKGGAIPSDCQLTIVGMPESTKIPFIADMLKKIRETGLEKNIRLIQNSPPDQMPGLYSDADLYIQASTMECLPLALLGAVARGLPTIATDADGCGEVIKHLETGLLVPPRNVQSLETAIEWAVKNPEKCYEMASNAQEHFSTFLTEEKAIIEILKDVRP